MSKTYESITTYTEEGPEGTRYRDSEGDTWYREGGGWYVTIAGERMSSYHHTTWGDLLDQFGPFTEVPTGPQPDQKYIIGKAHGCDGLWAYKDGHAAWVFETASIYAWSEEFEPGWEEAVVATKRDYEDLINSLDVSEARGTFDNAVLRNMVRLNG